MCAAKVLKMSVLEVFSTHRDFTWPNRNLNVYLLYIILPYLSCCNSAMGQSTILNECRNFMFFKRGQRLTSQIYHLFLTVTLFLVMFQFFNGTSTLVFQTSRFQPLFYTQSQHYRYGTANPSAGHVNRSNSNQRLHLVSISPEIWDFLELELSFQVCTYHCQL